MPDHTDTEVIEILAVKAGGHESLATRLGVTRQTLWLWKQSGIHKNNRFAVAALADEYGIDLPSGFAVLTPAESRGAA